MLGLLAAAGIMAVLIAVACCKRSGDFSEQEEAGEQELFPAPKSSSSFFHGTLRRNAERNDAHTP